MEGTDPKSGQEGNMVITSDIWLAPDIPGYGEVQELHRVMAAKVGWSPGESFGSMMGGSGMMKGMAEASKEMTKLHGIPVLQVMAMTGGAAGMAPVRSGDSSSTGALMEITTESSRFSSAPVDASKFDIPSGFQQVEPEMGRRGGRR